MKKHSTLKTLWFIYFLIFIGTKQTHAQCWKKISASLAHTIAIKTDGTLWSWGSNLYGELGDGTSVDKYSPIQIGTETNWANLSAGTNHTVAIKTDGTLWAWGANYYGQLGDSTTVYKHSPVQIGTETNWASASAGDSYTLAIKTDGTLWAWGYNDKGQLGDGTTVDKYSPVQINSNIHWASISAGESHTLAIKTDGSLWAWGKNQFGQLGDNTTIDKYSPIKIGTNWERVKAGADYTLAIKTNGSLWAWGENNYTQFGGGNAFVNSPLQIGKDTNWAVVGTGFNHIAGIKTDGSLWVWGYNLYGQLGNGTSVNTTSPNQMGLATDWVNVDAGDENTLAIKTNGTLWAWGDNGNGQLGDGSILSRNEPVLITCSGLPIAMRSFTASRQNNNVILQWSTATEQNSNYFAIERSYNGKTFETIGTLPTKGFAASYSFTDGNPFFSSVETNGSSEVYYRLQQFDKNGSFTYSHTKQVNFSSNGQFAVYPNPAQGIVIITGNHIASLQILDNIGRQVKEVKLSDATNPTLCISNLLPCFYHLRIQTTENKVSVVGFVKQ